MLLSCHMSIVPQATAYGIFFLCNHQSTKVSLCGSSVPLAITFFTVNGKREFRAPWFLAYHMFSYFVLLVSLRVVLQTIMSVWMHLLSLPRCQHLLFWNSNPNFKCISHLLFFSCATGTVLSQFLVNASLNWPLLQQYRSRRSVSHIMLLGESTSMTVSQLSSWSSLSKD